MPAARSAAVLVAVLAIAAPAHADDGAGAQLAREAYDRGAVAFQEGSYGVAALEFARADELAPNPVALESALKAVVLTDEAALGMTLADRADGAVTRVPSESLAAAAKAARDRFAGRAGRVSVQCGADPANAGCGARIDGKAVRIGERRWVTAGERTIDIEVGARRETHVVRVDAGATVDWAPAAAGRAPRAPVVLPAPALATGAPPGASKAPIADRPGTAAAQRRPLSPLPFWIGVGATALLGGASIWSGLDTLDKHQAYLDGDDDAEDPGRDAQLRTNVLVGAAALAGVATIVIGVVAVEWSSPEPQAPRASLSLAPSGVRFAARW